MATLDRSLRRLGRTDLHVTPLCLGGNVFGWTAGEQQSYAILDRYVAAGGNFIDTADQYSNWVPGHEGGESEAIIGKWLRRSGQRDHVVLATKVGHMGGLGRPGGLTAASISRRTDASLARLGVDHVDLLYAHHDDPGTPLEETMTAFDAIVKEGKARYVAASNYTSGRLEEALATSDRLGVTRFVALQAYYNLLERERFEDELGPLCLREGLAGVAYWVLAKGFLTGKYREGASVRDGARGLSDRAVRHRVHEYASARAYRILDVIEEVARKHDATAAAVAVAWTGAQPGIVAPIASARTTEQLDDLLDALRLQLDEEDQERLRDASEPGAS